MSSRLAWVTLEDATAADFGKLDKHNWVVVTVLDASDAQAYNGWFVAGPVIGKHSGLAGKGNSDAQQGPAERGRTTLTGDELAACVAELVAVKHGQRTRLP